MPIAFVSCFQWLLIPNFVHTATGIKTSVKTAAWSIQSIDTRVAKRAPAKHAAIKTAAGIPTPKCASSKSGNTALAIAVKVFTQTTVHHAPFSAATKITELKSAKMPDAAMTHTIANVTIQTPPFKNQSQILLNVAKLKRPNEKVADLALRRMHARQ